MSIANLIVQPDAAYIVTDSGAFDCDGTVLWLAPKVFIAERDLFAYGVVGTAASVILHAARELDKRGQAIEVGPPEAFLALIRQAYDHLGADPVRHYSRFVAAGYSRELGKPVGLTFFTNPADALPGEQPWTWYESPGLLMPYISPAEHASLGTLCDLSDPAVFDPLRDSMLLVEAVRQRRTGWDVGNGCYVAGKITLTKVSSKGVEVALLHEYPDQIGEKAGACDEVQAQNARS